jgi:large subunit ribosomal protein L25
MKLTMTSRKEKKKGEINEIRRKKDIPAVLYSSGKEGESIIIDGAEFSAALRHIKPGQLATTIFTLSDGKKQRRALIKDIQRTITNYQVSHIDFEELIDGRPVSVKVPISFKGVAECIGVKLGGFLRQVIRTVKVECLPEHIPSEFFVDVQDLSIWQKRRLSDIAMPQGVKPLVALEEVVVIVAKR